MGGIKTQFSQKPLRKDQIAAVKAVLHGFKTEARGQLIMPSGSGKTLTALHVAAEVGAKRILLLFPSLALLSQTIGVWRQSATFASVPLLPVCSDPTVDEETARIQGATTDPENIARWLSAQTGPAIIAATYQSSDRIAAAFSTGGSRMAPFDLVILDEAHRCTGRKDSAFTVALTDAIPARRRLFLTATPRVLRRVDKTADDDAMSMDNPLVFGPVFYRMTLREAIKLGILSDYQIVVTVVREDVHDKHLREGARDDLSGIAVHTALARCMEQYGASKVVTFHNRVRDAAAFAATMQDLAPTLFPDGRMVATHVHGRQSDVERQRAIERLRATTGERVIIANARCLSEGVDIPALDAVLLTCPRRSEIDLLQITGRVLRTSPGKTQGTVMLPVVLPEGMDAASALNAGPFNFVWSVLRSIKAHDVELSATLDAEARESARDGRPGVLPLAVDLHLPDGVDASFIRAFNAVAVTEAASTWETMYGMLERYVSEHRLSTLDRETDEPLALWVALQRGKRSKLSSHHFQRLEAIPGWTWPVEAGARPPLTEKVIADAMKAHKRRFGKWPNIKSEGATIAFEFPESWHAVDVALAQGCRGLPGGDSLSRFKNRVFGVRHPHCGIVLTEPMIWEAAQKHHADTGFWPTHCSGDASQYFGHRRSWEAVNGSLRKGGRGVEGGDSLSALLKRHGVEIRRGARPKTLRGENEIAP